MLYPAFSDPQDIEDLVEKWSYKISDKAQVIYDNIINELSQAISNNSLSLETHRELLSSLMRKHSHNYQGKITKSDLLYVFNNGVKTGKYGFNIHLLNTLTKKIGKSESGIVSITLMTSPGDFSCPQDCHYCPNDPKSARSYDSQGPVALRASALKWDVVNQFRDRAMNLASMGHSVTKIEILIIGGTWSYHTKPYQEEFIRGIYYAANTFQMDDPRMPYDLETEISCNETANSRIIGLTIETRPDHINISELVRLRRYGVTRVQLGVQHLDDRILSGLNRKCTTDQTYVAFKLLLENGFKIDAHFMPDLPGSSYEQDLEMFQWLFSDENQIIQADQLKIYPTMVTRYTKILEWYKDGTYIPYSEIDNGKHLFDLIIYIATHVPLWIRINRIVRDIPSHVISGKFKETNMYQRIQKHMKDNNLTGTDIRSREIGHNEINKDNCQIFKNTYRSSNGTEYFISYESCDEDQRKILGFIRVRVNDDPVAPYFDELKNAILIRELHVYGKLVPQGETIPPLNPLLGGNQHQQHRGIGKILLEQAKTIAVQHKHLGFTKIAVISGVGVRKYYERNGYKLEGTYMTQSIIAPKMCLASKCLISSLFIKLVFAILH